MIKINSHAKSKWDFLFSKFKQEPVKSPELFQAFKKGLPTINDIKITVRNFSGSMKTYFLYGEKNLNENGVDEDIVNRFVAIRYNSEYKLPENANSKVCILYTVYPKETANSFAEWKASIGKKEPIKELI